MQRVQLNALKVLASAPSSTLKRSSPTSFIFHVRSRTVILVAYFKRLLQMRRERAERTPFQPFLSLLGNSFKRFLVGHRCCMAVFLSKTKAAEVTHVNGISVPGPTIRSTAQARTEQRVFSMNAGSHVHDDQLQTRTVVAFFNLPFCQWKHSELMRGRLQDGSVCSQIYGGSWLQLRAPAHKRCLTVKNKTKRG